MASQKWNKHLRASKRFGKVSCCLTKIQHRTFSAAFVAAESASKKYGKMKTPYPCPYCKLWHVGRLLSPHELK